MYKRQYSNFENKVAQSIRDQAAQRNLADKFDEVLVPTEKVVEVRRGRKVEAAVSYTHLDVYKRQGSSSSTISARAAPA